MLIPEINKNDIIKSQVGDYYKHKKIFVKKEIIEKLAILITSAFGLVAALAWNSAIQEIFKRFFGESSSIMAMLGYAFIVTVVAVIATIWIGKMSEKFKK